MPDTISLPINMPFPQRHFLSLRPIHIINRTRLTIVSTRKQEAGASYYWLLLLPVVCYRCLCEFYSLVSVTDRQTPICQFKSGGTMITKHGHIPRPCLLVYATIISCLNNSLQSYSVHSWLYAARDAPAVIIPCRHTQCIHGYMQREMLLP